MSTVEAGETQRRSQYVVAFNGARDFYQLPWGFHEHDLLSSLVTDAYYPHDRPILRRIPGMGVVRRRYTEGLPSSRVHWTWPALAPQIAARFRHSDQLHLFERVDRALSEAALRHAEREQAHLFLYSQYAYQAFTSDRSRGMAKGLFMFHPHTDLIREILDQDFERYPECRQSHERERDTSIRTTRIDELRDEWKYAEFIVCTSSFTAHSLRNAGCPASVISVVPYGINPTKDEETPPKRDPQHCRFLFVGQGVQRKGLHHLLRAWARAALSNAELTIIATNLDPGIAKLSRADVRLLPRQSAEQLSAWFRACDVFVMPSLVEGFGLVFLEALAAGCHCIGTQNTGMPDIAQFFPTNVHALSIIPAGDIDQLAASLEAAERLHRHGEFDRRRIQELSKQITWSRFRKSVAMIARSRLIGKI
jgi:glycosyltransferase involved in cell wall biosynthesis